LPLDLDYFEQRYGMHDPYLTDSGPHRCIGSHLARLNLRVIFEKILSRMQDIRITTGDPPRRTPASMERGLEYLPISFTPTHAEGVSGGS
jgi:cytochrome P450